MLGRPSRVGSSEKQNARTPRSALRRISADRELDVPERHEAQRQVHPARRLTPLLDHPVVVGLDAGERELLVAGLVERLPTEARERGERKRPVDPVELEVGNPRVALVAAGTHSVVRDRGHRHRAAVELADVTVGRGLDRDGDELLVHVDQAVLVDPGVAPVAVGVLGVGVLRARVVHEGCPPFALDPRTALAVLRGEVRLPHVRRLDDVVVDTHDLRDVHARHCVRSLLERPTELDAVDSRPRILVGSEPWTS